MFEQGKGVGIRNIDTFCICLSLSIANYTNTIMPVACNVIWKSGHTFAAILLGVNLPLSSLAGITEFKIRSRCKDWLTSFKITINVKALMQKLYHE